MRWLVIEPRVSGHHAVYLERIVEGALENGIEVILGTSARESTADFCERLTTIHAGKPLILEPMPAACGAYGSLGASIRREIGYLRYFRRVYERAVAKDSIDRVFIPYLDYCYNAMGILGSPFKGTRVEGICMGPTFHFRDVGVVAPRKKADPLKRRVFLRFLGLSSVGRVFCLDPTFSPYFRSRGLPHASKLLFFPDPAEFVGEHTRESARAALGIPANAKVLLLYGSLDVRKGVEALLDRLRDPSSDATTHVLLVGRQTAAVAELLQRARAGGPWISEKLHEVKGFVTPQQEQMVFAAADTAWLKYEGFYQMSGVLVKAVKAHLDLELPDTGLLGWYKKALARGEAPDFSENDWSHVKALLFETTSR